MGSRIIPLLLLFAVVAPLAAQEPGEVRLFDEDETEIRIKAATKTEVPLSKAPGSVTLITHQQIKESGARTIPEVLRMVAGINVRWNPMVQTIDMRGFGSNPFTSRVLLMIDGVPFNAGDKGGFPQHPGLDFFVLQSIKRIEIVRGPGSALYGENAFWGVLNIVTLSGEDLQGGEVEIYGGDRETGAVNATVGQKLGEDGSIFVSAKYLQSKFPTVFWAEEQDSKVDGTDLFFKATYKGFQASYYRHEDTVEGFNEVIAEPGLPPGSAFKSADEITQNIDIFTARYDYQKQGKWSLSGDVSTMQRFGMHCGACHASAESLEFLKPADHGGQVIGNLNFGIQAVSGHDLLFGVESRHVSTGDHSHELGLGRPDSLPPSIQPPDDPGDAPNSYTKSAFYVQDQMTFADDRLRVVAGFRYDGKNNLFDDTFSPRIAGVVDVTDRLVFRTGWSTAFRYPNFSERYQDSWFINVQNDFFAAPLAVFSPNPGIQPERIETVEAGFEYRFSDAASAKLDFHRSQIEDFIVLTYGLLPPPQPSLVRFENHPDKANLWGTELEFRMRPAEGFRAVANWSYQQNEQVGDLVDSVGNPIEFSYAPANKFTLGTYFGPFEGIGGNFEMQWHGEYTGPSFYYLLLSGLTDPTVRPLPSYTLANFRLNYDLPIGWNGLERPWRLSFYAKNLFDEQPRETLIGVDTRLVGREFFFGTSFRF